MDRESREAHKDHLVAQAEGGTNQLSNLVLSCGICNGDEKRELDWEGFLAAKCGDDRESFERRKDRITRWIESNGGRQTISEQEQQLIDSAFDRIDAVLTECVERLREIRDN